jgi:hypothetical protein
VIVAGTVIATPGVVDNAGMLHFQKLDVYQRSIEFLSIPQNIAEGCGRIVAMLTKLIDP